MTFALLVKKKGLGDIAGSAYVAIVSGALGDITLLYNLDQNLLEFELKLLYRDRCK